jgi:hypothetical protein
MYYRMIRLHWSEDSYGDVMSLAESMRDRVEPTGGLMFAELAKTGEGEGMIIAAYESEATYQAVSGEVAFAQRRFPLFVGTCRVASSRVSLLPVHCRDTPTTIGTSSRRRWLNVGSRQFSMAIIADGPASSAAPCCARRLRAKEPAQLPGVVGSRVAPCRWHPAPHRRCETAAPPLPWATNH